MGTTRNSCMVSFLASSGLPDPSEASDFSERPNQGEDARHKVTRKLYIKSCFDQGLANLCDGISTAMMSRFVKMAPQKLMCRDCQDQPSSRYQHFTPG